MPSKNGDIGHFSENLKKDGTELYEKVKRYPLISLCFIIAVLFLIIIPYLQVDYQGISNSTVKATLENQYRATLAQVFGGAAIGISLYYTWRRIAIAEEELKTTQENLKATQEIAQNNLKVSQESQITERFTRAIDQLGNPAIEIRLGGIYALERISKESEEDYWPIMEILTAYVRKNSIFKIAKNRKVTNLAMDIQANESITSKVPEIRNIPLDIQAVITVIRRRKHSFENGEANSLGLQETNLHGANLFDANLSRVNLSGADLSDANLSRADLSEADLSLANLSDADLFLADLSNAKLSSADLSGAKLSIAKLSGAKLSGARNLTIDQLSKVKTLYGAELDEELFISLKEKYPRLFDEPKFI
jgi:Uncharacterized low-complexity proteins